ncbi:MAG: electron transport complex subunit RsxC [Oscillospiraceae bacterium]|nr:electron transport complex subunit RsxC [Oscillospiraceae bacterium]
MHSSGEGKKQTKDVPIRAFVSDTVAIPMSMHIGAPSKPCVNKGDLVKRGQVIGEPVGPLGLPVHASISGEVVSVEERLLFGASPTMTVTIKNDFADEWVEGIKGLGNVETIDPSLVVDAVKNAGICGMGGAAFPTHVKLTVGEGKSCDTIIINGAECETYLTSDYRLMVEKPRRVVDGLRAVMRALNVYKGILAIEENKPKAISAMREAARGRDGVEVRVLRTKYPQGGEKQLIKALTGREVPSGKLPLDVHTIVINAATSAAIADAIIDGLPLTERITTVTGCVNAPANLQVRIGTMFEDIISACEGYSEEPGKIIAGGGMTGPCSPDDTMPITKGGGGIVVLGVKDAKSAPESPCIRCARCVQVCPMGLDPFKIKNFCDKGDLKGAQKNSVMECIMCGCCSYICPARRQLTAAFKEAKADIMQEARRQKQ